jgi:hypothetical protein
VGLKQGRRRRRCGASGCENIVNQEYGPALDQPRPDDGKSTFHRTSTVQGIHACAMALGILHSNK